MKSKYQILKWLAMLLILIISSGGAMAQHQTTCSGTKSYSVNDVTSGNKFSWTVSPALPDGSISNASGSSTDITWPNPAVPTNYTVTFREINDDTHCWAERLLTVTVTPNNTVALNSGASTDDQTVCIGSPLTDIVYTTTGASGASVTDLPDGVIGSWENNELTISGTPSEAGIFTYTVTLEGGCSTVTTTGTITVNPNNSVVLSSAASTANQTVCINSAITEINYTTEGATDVEVTGLPTGVTYSWENNELTISGTPSVSSSTPYTYTITISGGCGSDATITGTITVNPNSSVALSSAANTASQIVCINSAITEINYATEGATSASVTGLPTGVSYTRVGNVVKISGTPSVSSGSPYTYTVTVGGGCGSNATITGTITVNPNNSVALSSIANTDAQTVCINTAITEITYATESTAGVTTVNVTGLPTGVNYTWVGNVVKINGTPSVSSGSPYTYTITVSGGCGSDATITGTITVNPINTITLSSAAQTDAQIVCTGNTITNIVYTTTGATGASVTGLPNGVIYLWEDNKLTISGTPSESSSTPFSYTITLNNGCGNVTTTGTIEVNPLPNPSEINFN